MTRRCTLGPLAIAVLGLMAAFSDRAALAQDGQWKTLDVGVLPVVYLGPSGEDLFAERPETARLRALAARWHKGLEEALSGRDLVRASGLVELRNRLRRAGDFARTAALADERYAMGLERWRALAFTEALTQLERARALHLEAFTDLLDPRSLSDVELHRALAMMDLQQEGQALIAFASMILRDPTRRFDAGYYGARIEATMKGAARQVLEVPDPIAVLWPADRLIALGRRLGLEYFAVGVVTGEEASAALTVGIFDVRAGGFALRERFALADGEAVVEDVDRLLAGWHTCALEETRPLVAPRPRHRWAVELGYSHFVWVQHRRTRDYLHGPSVSLTVAYEATPGLELWGRSIQRVTLTDGKGDLRDVFTTSHLAFGVGLAVGDDRWRFSVRSGLDLGLSLADIAITTDVDCKFFGPESERCGGLYRAESPAVWFGLDFGLSLKWAPRRTWSIGLAVGATSYALAGSIVGELNFPLYGTLAFGLPF